MPETTSRQIAWRLTSWTLEPDTAWIQVLALPCTSSVILGKSLNLSGPLFPHLLMGK